MSRVAKVSGTPIQEDGAMRSEAEVVPGDSVSAKEHTTPAAATAAAEAASLALAMQLHEQEVRGAQSSRPKRDRKQVVRLAETLNTDVIRHEQPISSLPKSKKKRRHDIIEASRGAEETPKRKVRYLCVSYGGRLKRPQYIKVPVGAEGAPKEKSRTPKWGKRFGRPATPVPELSREQIQEKVRNAFVCENCSTGFASSRSLSLHKARGKRRCAMLASGVEMGELRRSKYRGVNWDNTRFKWTAQITIQNKSYCLGTFEDELDAARAFSEAWKKAGLPLSNNGRTVLYSEGTANSQQPAGAAGQQDRNPHDVHNMVAKGMACEKGEDGSIYYSCTVCPRKPAPNKNVGSAKEHCLTAGHREAMRGNLDTFKCEKCGWVSPTPAGLAIHQALGRRCATRADMQSAGCTLPVSNYDGVHWYNRGMRWRTSIRAQGKTHYLGEYDDEEEAAKAYRAGQKKWLPAPEAAKHRLPIAAANVYSRTCQRPQQRRSGGAPVGRLSSTPSDDDDVVLDLAAPAVGRCLEYKFEVAGQERWFPGVITRVSASTDWYDVRFDDGEKCCVRIARLMQGVVWRWAKSNINTHASEGV